MQKLISCLMANYNTDVEMLRKSIESILNQTYSNFEFIIVDDCSTDDSVQVLEEYAEKDARIVLLKNTVNSGLAYSLNRALEIAKGEYIARMDSDDIALAERFQCQVQFLKKNSDIDICGTFAKIFGNAGGYSFTPYCSVEDAKSQILYSPYLIHPTVMMRKVFLEQNNFRYNENYRCSQDFELWSRCAGVGNIATINKVLLLYRVHAKQISTEKRTLQKQYAEEICKKQLMNLGIDCEKDMTYHMMICGLKEIGLSDVREMVAWAEYLLEKNLDKSIYVQKNMKKILFNRIFNLILKSDLNFRDKISALIKNKHLLSVTNILSVICRICYQVRFKADVKKYHSYIEGEC